MELPVVRLMHCLVLAAAVSGLASAAPVSDPPASRAEDFVEALGLAASPFDRYLSEGRFKGAGTKYPPECFFDLGVRYYRTGLRHDLTNPQQAELVAEWWQRTGSRPMLLVDAGKSKTLKDGDFSFLIEDLKRYTPGSIAEVEGPNELNNKFPPQELNMRYKGRTDEAAGSAYQTDLCAALRGDPQTAGIPLVMYTAIFTEYALARPCSAFDFLNMHSYQGAGVPSSSLLMNMTRAATILPPESVLKPFVPTECGYNVEEDKTNHQGYHGSRRAQAYNIPMLWAEYFRHGIRRTYLFALHNADGYGLLESDQTTKRPSWYAVQSFVRLLADAAWNGDVHRWEGGREFLPRALRFRLEGAPESVHTLCLQKQNGEWFLLIWNEVQNFRNGADTRQAPVPATLHLAPETAAECVAAYAQGDIPDDVYATPEGVRQGAFVALATPPVVDQGVLRLSVPSSVLILRLRPTGTPGDGPGPQAPVAVTGTATENSVGLAVTLPPNHGAVAVQLFRNDMYVGTLPAAATVTYADRSAWIRPGLGYRYAAQALAADGRLSARVEGIVQTPNRHPDLVIGDFGPDVAPGTAIQPGDKVRFRGTVRNVGNGATPQAAPPSAGMYNSAVAITFSVDGKVVSWGGDGGQKPFPAGGERTHVGDGGPHGCEWTAEEGTHVIRAYADDINRICGEWDKANNYATRSVTIGTYPGSLAIESRPAPTRVDLAAEGTEDWVHFGAWKEKGTLSRKRGANQIGAIEQIGKGYIDLTAGCPVSLAWHDADGVEKQNDTHAGLWGNGVGNGFTFTVPADTEERVLRVYVAAIEGARCEFSATLSDHSAPAVLDGSWNGNRAQNWAPVPGGFSAAYEVRYRAAAAGQTLTVGWKLVDEPNRFLGQIRLQAATLRRAP